MVWRGVEDRPLLAAKRSAVRADTSWRITGTPFAANLPGRTGFAILGNLWTRPRDQYEYKTSGGVASRLDLSDNRGLSQRGAANLSPPPDLRLFGDTSTGNPVSGQTGVVWSRYYRG